MTNNETIILIIRLLSLINFEVILKLSLCCIVGTIIGKERKKKEKPGGARTFSLIAMSSALIGIIVLLLADKYTFDVTRLIGSAMSGIGFLGAGIIMQNKKGIEGLTTASTIWIMIPIGFLIGLNFYQIAIIATTFIYLILESKYRKALKQQK